MNQEILEDLEDPKDPNHLDYRYLKSKSGPLYEGVNQQSSEYKVKSEVRTTLHTKLTSIERKAYGGVRMC